MLLAADAAPIDALAAALSARGIAAVPIFVASLKDAAALAFVERAAQALTPASDRRLHRLCQRRRARERRPCSTAWACLCCRRSSPRRAATFGQPTSAAWRPPTSPCTSLLPELDGRIHAGAIAFKAARQADDALGFRGMANRPEPDRIEQVADRVAAFLRLQATPRAERRLAVLIPDYPAAPGRSGYAVGLDVPASVLAMLHDLAAAGYRVEGIPDNPRALMQVLELRGAKFDISTYRSGSDTVDRAWGRPQDDADRRGRRLPFPRHSLWKCDGGLRARSRSGERPARRLSRSGAAAPPRACRLRPMAAAASRPACASCMSAPMARSNGCPARRWRCRPTAFRNMVAGPLPGRLSLHRQQSWRSRAGQAPYRCRDARSPAAAAGPRRPRSGSAGSGTIGRRICAGRWPRSPPPRPAGAADRRAGAHQRGRRGGRRRWRRGPRPGLAAHRCLALRPQGLRGQGRPAHVYGRAAAGESRRRCAWPALSPSAMP